MAATTGERLIGRSLTDIAPNHVARYFWARDQLDQLAREDLRILDAACGVGYGGKIISSSPRGYRVHGVDRAGEAELHFPYFANHLTSFERCDVMDATGTYDAVVSIETIEHIEDDAGWVRKMGEMAPVVIGTVPNQDVCAFDPDKYLYHFRHYTQADVLRLFDGWDVAGWWTQYDKWNPERAKMRPGHDGMTLGFVAVKK